MKPDMDSMLLTSGEIRLVEEYRAAKAEAEAAMKARLWRPKPLTEYSAAEKCAVFDQLYALALGDWEYLIGHGYADDDFDAYAGEALRELLGPSIHDAWNAIIL